MKKLTVKKIQKIVARLEKLNPTFNFEVRSEFVCGKNIALCFDHPQVEWSGDYSKASDIEGCSIDDGFGSIPIEITRKDDAAGYFQPIDAGSNGFDSTIMTIEVHKGQISISKRLTECANLFKTFEYKN